MPIASRSTYTLFISALLSLTQVLEESGHGITQAPPTLAACSQSLLPCLHGAALQAGSRVSGGRYMLLSRAWTFVAI